MTDTTKGPLWWYTGATNTRYFLAKYRQNLEIYHFQLSNSSGSVSSSSDGLVYYNLTIATRGKLVIKIEKFHTFSYNYNYRYVASYCVSFLGCLVIAFVWSFLLVWYFIKVFITTYLLLYISANWECLHV